jgi:hypothetical protein
MCPQWQYVLQVTVAWITGIWLLNHCKSHWNSKWWITECGHLQLQQNVSVLLLANDAKMLGKETDSDNLIVIM